MRYKYIITILLLTSLNHAYSQVIDYSTKIYIEDGEKLVRKSYTINISSIEDRETGEISIIHSSRSDFKLLNAKITDKNGEVVRSIKKKDLHEVSMRTRETFFQDNKVVKFNLHWNEYPYQITYSYEEKFTDFLTIANWYPVVFEKMATIHSSLELQVPIDYKMNIYSSPDLIFSEDTLPNGTRKLSWKSLLYKLPNKEKFAPPLEESTSRVIVIPDKFKHDIVGSSTTWADFGQWISRLNSNTENLAQSEIIVVDSLIAKCKTKKDTIRTLYHYLQDNTNYVNVSIGYGGLKSYPATYVSQNKYGDCKALTTYMKAMLKHVGIESYYTIINSGINEARIRESIPAQQFNHVILCVPVNEDTLWLENTSSSLPFDYLSVSNQNRFALLVDSVESRLIKTPTVSLIEVAELRKYNYYLDKNGTGTISAQGKLKGYAFERFSYIEKEWDEKDKKEAITDYFNLKYLELNDWKIKKGNRNNHCITLTVNGKVVKRIKDIGNLKIIKPVFIKIPEFETPENRKQPLRFNYPINESDSINYHLPYLELYNYQLPDSAFIESKYGSFILNSYKIGNEIKIHRQLIILKGDYPLDEYPSFYEFISKIEQIQKKSSIILTPLNTEIHE